MEALEKGGKKWANGRRTGICKGLTLDSGLTWILLFFQSFLVHFIFLYFPFSLSLTAVRIFPPGDEGK